jgi:hypothetical protein
MKRMLDKRMQAVLCSNSFAAINAVHCLNEAEIPMS